MKNYNEVANELFERRKQHQIKRNKMIKMFSICTCCILFIGSLILLNGKPGINNQEVEYMYITNYPSNNLDWFYMPKPTELIVVENVGESRKVYENDNTIKYLVKLEIYDENGIVKDDELLKEYQRLLESGIVFYEVNVWTYNNPNDKVYRKEIIIEMNNELFENFNINEKYGYLFSFIGNGDGSNITINDCNIIKSFSK